MEKEVLGFYLSSHPLQDYDAQHFCSMLRENGSFMDIPTTRERPKPAEP